MTTADLYRRLTLPPRVVVFGWELVPYTVGHAILFDRLEIESVTTPAEICLAARLCSMPADKAEQWLTGRWSGWRLRWMVWTRAAWMRDPAEVAKAVEVWSRWLDEQTRFPRYVNKSGSGEESGVPFCQRLRIVLMGRLGYSSAEVARTPYLQALWDYVAWAESEGLVNVPHGMEEEKEKQLIQQADEVAKILAEGRYKPNA